MNELGRPDADLHGALVGGTNGKGSVVAMVR
jgi:folylpolyglutamate synthase/dihydropteroate synthase